MAASPPGPVLASIGRFDSSRAITIARVACDEGVRRGYCWCAGGALQCSKAPMIPALAARMNEAPILSPIEKKAIRSFLEFVRDELADSYTREKISSAIAQYWGQF